jgi:hypothetical protein
MKYRLLFIGVSLLSFVEIFELRLDSFMIWFRFKKLRIEKSDESKKVKKKQDFATFVNNNYFSY